MVARAAQETRLAKLIIDGLEIARRNGQIHETHVAHFREDGAGHYSCCAITFALLASAGGDVQAVADLYRRHGPAYLSAVARHTGLPAALLKKVDHRQHYFDTPCAIISKLLVAQAA